MRILPISYNLFWQNKTQQNHSSYISTTTLKQDEVSFSGNSGMSDNEYAIKHKSVTQQLYTRLKQENLDPAKFKDFPIYLEKDTVDFAQKLINDKEFPIHLITNVIGEISGVNILKPYV